MLKHSAWADSVFVTTSSFSCSFPARKEFILELNSESGPSDSILPSTVSRRSVTAGGKERGFSESSFAWFSPAASFSLDSLAAFLYRSSSSFTLSSSVNRPSFSRRTSWKSCVLC